MNTVDPLWFWLTAVIEAVLVSGGVFAFLKLGPSLIKSLAAMDLKSATPSLVYNIFAYSIGPSIFALVPFYGWGLAALLIAFNLMVGGKRRLYLKASNAIVNVIILFVMAALAGAVLYFVFPFIWGKMLGLNGLEVDAAPEPSAHHIPAS
jgi:hypothetical protein